MFKLLRKIRLSRKLFKRNHHCNLPYPELYFDREWQCWRCKIIWFKKIDRAGNEYFVKRR